MKLYRGGVQEDEAWHVQVDAGAYSPWLGASYRNYASRRAELQRSQMSGRYRRSSRPVLPLLRAHGRHRRSTRRGNDALRQPSIHRTTGPLQSARCDGPARSSSRCSKTSRLTSRRPFPLFDLADPAAVVPMLAQGLAKTLEALCACGGSAGTSASTCRSKSGSFMDAITRRSACA